MTQRGRALMLMALAGLCIGTIRLQFLLSLVSLSVIVWIVAEWVRFRSWVRIGLPRLELRRSINDRTSNGTLWAGRRIQMLVTVESPRPLKVNLRIRDFVPEQLEIVSPERSERPVKAERFQGVSLKSTSAWLNDLWDRAVHRFLLTLAGTDASPARQETYMLAGAQHAEIRYTANVLSAGRLALPGVRLVIEDIFGLFREHRFREFPQRYRVLPSYYQSGEFRPTIKRHNSLPRHGIHRLQRSGMGSELLELREYVPGDPPKSIAWKVSARRGKLLTRQYESEVPVRVHLIIDGSVPTRIGGFGLRLLDQINYVAASIAQAAISVGDPVDGVLIDEQGARRLPWYSGDRGMLEFLKALSDFSLKPPPSAGPVTEYMKQCALTVCHELYPELLDARFNRIPFSFRSDVRRRSRLVGVVSALYELPTQQHIECLMSDAALAIYLQRLLNDAGMPWMAPLLPAPDEPVKNSSRRMQAISRAILRAVLHAHDNEVFVVMADLLSAAPNFQSLERGVKLALARHHRVAFVCPTTTFTRPKMEAVMPGSNNVSDLLLAAEQTRIRDLASQLKRNLTRLGAAVSFSGEQTAIGMVLAEIDTARSGRSHRQGLRS